MNLSFVLICILGFIVVGILVKLLWNVAKFASTVLLMASIITFFGGGVYVDQVKTAIIVPIEKKISSKDINYKTVESQFKKEMGFLSKYASVEIVKDKEKSNVVKFKLFGVKIDDIKVK